MDGAQVIQILMVDDDPADVRITQEALAESKFVNELHLARDGEEALAFLRREPPFQDKPRPDLVLLDINMPRLDGHATLKAIRADPDLTDLIVVMLTTSDADADVIQAYKEHVNAYVTKPVDLERFFTIILEIEHFWMGIVRLPPETKTAQ